MHLSLTVPRIENEVSRHVVDGETAETTGTIPWGRRLHGRRQDG
jgi:hypothetical protein